MNQTRSRFTSPSTLTEKGAVWARKQNSGEGEETTDRQSNIIKEIIQKFKLKMGSEY